MPETLEDKLVVGISSRALFDLAAANDLVPVVVLGRA